MALQTSNYRNHYLSTGESAEAEAIFPLPDMRCPELPQKGLNFWSDSCRNKRIVSWGACAAKNCPAAVAPSCLLTCACGNHAASEGARKRHGVTRPLCPECLEAFVQRREAVKKEERRRYLNMKSREYYARNKK